MGLRVDFDDEKSSEQLQKFGTTGPTWLKFEKGKKRRVLFLGRALDFELIYDVPHAVELDEQDRPKYMGSFRSLTQKKRGLDLKAIETAVKANDFTNLEVDAKVLGVPKVLSAVLVLVYPTDNDGVLNKDYFQKGVLELGWMNLTPKRVEKFMNIHRTLKSTGKGLFDVDFVLELDDSSGEKYQKLVIKEQPESIYLKMKDKLKLEADVNEKIQAELRKYGLNHPSEVSKFLGRDLTEQGWHNILSKAGYDLSQYGVSINTPTAAVRGMSELPADPALETGVDWGDADSAA